LSASYEWNLQNLGPDTGGGEQLFLHEGRKTWGKKELDDRGSRVRFPTGAGNFSLHHRVQNGSGLTQPPVQWVPGALSLGVKRQGRETDHSLPSSAEVKECV
jgi:hypothetical protein